MRRILLLVADNETRGLLTNLLGRRYQLVIPDADSKRASEKPCDACIVDQPSLERYRDWVHAQTKAEAVAVFPVLIVASREEVRTMSRHAWDIVDEVILTPVERGELLVRLAGLLRMRRLSVELLNNRRKLTRISKATESTSDAINIADVDGTAIYLNQAFTDLYGFSVNELNVRGIPQTLFVQPHIGETIFATVREGRSWGGEVELNTKRGHTVPTLLRADTIEDDTGQPIGLISVCTDISELERARTAEHAARVLAEALRDTTTALTSTLDIDEVLERILANVGRVVPHDAASIMLVESDVARIARSRGYIERGVAEDDLKSLRLQVASTIHLHWMVKKRQPLIVPDTLIYPGWVDVLRTPWLRAYVGTPILLKDSIIGFLNLDSATPGFFTHAQAKHLSAFAEQAAIAIQNAQLHEKARALAALEERQRLARNLHDSVTQTLFSASVIAEALPRLWEQKPDTVLPRLAQLHQLTRGALAEMRILLLELRPTALLETNLVELLHQLTEGMMGRSQIAVSVTVEGESSVEADVKVGLYYIAEEALNNIIKHSRATQAAVHLINQPEGSVLRISDNGRGFAPDGISSTSLGLGIMRERAESIGAALQITSETGHGTIVEVIWPDNRERTINDRTESN